MKSILIFMLFVGVAWGGDITFTENEIIEMPLYYIPIPKMEDLENKVLKYKGDGTYEWVELMPNVTINPNPTADNFIIVLGPHHYKRICIEKEGDKRRCVDTKWLYLLMVSAGIQED